MKPIMLGTAVGLVLAYLIGYNQIYSRQQKQVRLLTAELTQEQSNQNLQKETEDIFKQLDGYRAKLPSTPESSWIADAAMNAGNRAGLTIESIQRETPVPEKLATHLLVNLSFQATYHQLGTFFNELEKMDHYIQVEQLSVSSDKSANGQSRVQMALGTIVPAPQSALLGKAINKINKADSHPKQKAVK